MVSLDSSVVGPQTYIVAQNPEVLAHLIKENENRGFSPAAYTAPASVFNTIAVDFEKNDVEPVLKTCPMPVQTLQKLDPEVSDAPPKSTLERTPSRTSVGSGTPRLGSLEREKSGSSSKMNSLERNARLINSSHSSLEKSGVFSPKLGSLERKSRTGSPKAALGSLERNMHMSLPYDPSSIPDYHPEPTIYQFGTEKTKDMQQYGTEECIYDFGGADVKSCAHKQQYFVQRPQQEKTQVWG